jgi:hypothetical protein
MTKQQESEILTRVGPGTPMGNVLRHYWFPALPPQRQFKDKVRAKAYRAAERNGIVYVYMGNAARLPPNRRS